MPTLVLGPSIGVCVDYPATANRTKPFCFSQLNRNAGFLKDGFCGAVPTGWAVALRKWHHLAPISKPMWVSVEANFGCPWAFRGPGCAQFTTQVITLQYDCTAKSFGISWVSWQLPDSCAKKIGYYADTTFAIPYSGHPGQMAQISTFDVAHGPRVLTRLCPQHRILRTVSQEMIVHPPPQLGQDLRAQRGNLLLEPFTAAFLLLSVIIVLVLLKTRSSSSKPQQTQ